MNPSTFLYEFTPDISGFGYDLMSHLAFLALLMILFYEGRRRQFPLASWILSIAILSTIVILGTRLATFDMAAWQQWWQDGFFPEGNQRSSISCILFFFLAVFLIRKGLRFKAPFIDAFAFVMPVVLIIRRLGCILAACCYGLPTNSDWGLRYMGPGHIRDQHWWNDIAGATKLGSAAVHPTPIYFIVAAVVTILLLIKFRSYFRQAGSLTLFSLSLLLSFRLFIEFFRDPATNHQLGGMLLGLKQVQWFLLVIVLLVVVIIWYRERRPLLETTISFPGLSRLLVVNVLLAAFVWWMQDGFTFSEKVGIHSFMLLSWIALGVQVISISHSWNRLKWQATIIVLFAFGLMSQTYPSNPDSLVGKSVKTLKMNWNMANVNDATYNCVKIEQGCVGNYCALADSTKPYGPYYSNMDFGIDVKDFYTATKRRSNREVTRYLTYGVEFQPELFRNRELDRTAMRANLMPYVGVGGKVMEIKAGLRMGSIWGIGDGIQKSKPLVFSTALRIGNPQAFHIIFNSEQSTAIGASIHSVDFSLNMNLSKYTNGHWQYLRLGASDVYFNASLFYIETGFRINKHWAITPRVGVTYRGEDSGRNDLFQHNSYGIGAYYRLGE